MARRSGVVAALVRMQREAERQRVRQARAAAQSQRAAATARNRAAVQDQKQRDRMYAEDRMQEAADETAEVEHQVEILQNVLAATLGVDDYLDLEALKRPPPYPVFDPLSVGAPPSPPRESDFAMEGPSAMGRVFAASKHAARAEQRQAEYQQALYGYRNAAQQHAQRLEKARIKHDSDVARQAEQHRQNVEEISALQRGLAARQPDAVVRYLDLVLEAAEYPDGFPHSWRLAYAAGVWTSRHRIRVAASGCGAQREGLQVRQELRHDHPVRPPGYADPQHLRRSAAADRPSGRARSCWRPTGEARSARSSSTGTSTAPTRPPAARSGPAS